MGGRRGRPITSDSPEAVRKRGQRKRQKLRRIEFEKFRIEDGDVWLRILVEYGFMPKDATFDDATSVFLRLATQNFFEWLCTEYRQEEEERRVEAQVEAA